MEFTKKLSLKYKINWWWNGEHIELCNILEMTRDLDFQTDFREEL